MSKLSIRCCRFERSDCLMGIVTIASSVILVGLAMMLLVVNSRSRQDSMPQLSNLEAINKAMAAEEKQVDIRVGNVTFSFVRVPPGEYEMGVPPSEDGPQPNTLPIRRVRISKPVYLACYEVTQLQYKEVMANNPSHIQGDSYPVHDITYHQALQFCRMLSDRVGMLITLPTEAQWEYACRAGTTSRYHSGENVGALDKVGWHRGNADNTIHPVGNKQPNAFGLYDMHGNVWEPCADFILDTDEVQNVDPKGTMNGSYGAIRGGGWMHPPDYCCAATRLKSSDMFGGMGIRIALPVPE